MRPPLIYRLLRPLLLRLEPESAHALSLAMLRLVGALPPVGHLVRRFQAPSAATPVDVLGLRFANRVGLAAGYDKDASGWRGLACLGFGHVEIGTVTPRAQPGNPRPRVFRLVDERSLINRLGFPGVGADVVARRLEGRRPPGLIVGINLGKQRETAIEAAATDYEALIERFAPLADYLTINVSSPNTRDLRRLEQDKLLRPLLERLTRARDAAVARLGRSVPLLVKLSPDLHEVDLARTLDAVVASAVDGVVATNTTIGRDGIASPRAAETGGLSGALLTARSTEVVRRIREHAGPDLPIVASGGVMTPDDARAKIEAGACLVQLYTGLIYEGPSLVRRIADALA